MASGDEPGPDDELVAETVALVASWLTRAQADESRGERRMARRMAALIGDDSGVRFTMRFVDRVARHRHDRLAARQLAVLVRGRELPEYLGFFDRLMLRVGGWIAPLFPRLVVSLARRRMRQLVGHLVIDSEPRLMDRHFADQRSEGYRLNINLLGEAVLGEDEARRRRERTLALIDRDDIVYVSVKVSSIASQIDLWAFDHELERIEDRLRELFRRSAASSPPTFVNLDMEEYRDLELTVRAFTTVLAEREFDGLDAGIVLQAYLPDAFDVLRRLVAWASDRHARGGGAIKIRLVKGANLAMERVDAAMHGWHQAPFETKAEVDANYKRCVDWVLTEERTRGVSVGLASHNLFDVAWTHLLAKERGLSDRVEFEMLQGMAPAQQRIVREATGGLLLYTPVVREDDFDVAIAYLFRRLEENAAPDNFLRHLLTLRSGSVDFDAEAERFRAAVADRHAVSTLPRRIELPARPVDRFANQPDTDPTASPTRRWLTELRERPWQPTATALTEDPDAVQELVEAGRPAQVQWWGRGAKARRQVLRGVADELHARRGALLVAMAHEASKTFPEADSEVSEAVDFARWYAERGLELEQLEGVEFSPRGVIAVIPPWNFPVAIPAGGVLAALAAGNSVVFKPAPETPRCAELVAEACWSAGVPREVLQFVRLPDSEAGRRLVETVDGVILTGSTDTAALFRSWRPDLALMAETSGKNALVVTPQADLDLAAADLVRSAFGHSGQKCSAASLAILVGEVYDDERFRRQLVDAARSLRVGPPTDPATAMGPTIGPVEGKLARALGSLDPGEAWLLEPRALDDGGALWSPGIKEGVVPGSFFHQTECFGPVLGLMRAETLDEAIAMQNGTEYGLTGGIHSLDEREIEQWLDRVEVGNAYINRPITGAIVQRQPFGGWKRSAVGPGAKAGGPDYLLALGTWRPLRALDEPILDDAAWSDEKWWADHYGTEHDPEGLFCEANVLRYRVHPAVVIRAGTGCSPVELERVRRAAHHAGAVPPVSVADGDLVGPPEEEVVVETEEAFRTRLEGLRWGRVRLIGTMEAATREAANTAGVDVIDAAVTGNGRLELRWFLREQAVSRTVHRFGNLVGATERS